MACTYANGADRTTAASAPGAGALGIANCDDRHAYTARVGAFRANAFGLHDMLGNVWEWVEDCWNARYAGAPADGSVWNAGDCSKRVLRGGGWYFGPRNVRLAKRLKNEPTKRGHDLGFRVARALP
jgi:formylglycine-generating enzyme required for sulfatase activity